MSSRPPAIFGMTSPSGPEKPPQYYLADLPAIARLSLHLAVAMIIGGPSCLVTQNIEYELPAARGPFILDGSVTRIQGERERTPVLEPVGGSGQLASYSPWQVLSIEPSEDALNPYPQLRIRAFARSENLENPLQFFVFLDYEQADWSSPARRRMSRLFAKEAPSQGYDEPVLLETDPFQLPATLNPGCHTITLVVTHGYDWFEERPVLEDGSTAMRTWWLDVKDENGASVTMDKCWGAVMGKTRQLPPIEEAAP